MGISRVLTLASTAAGRPAIRSDCVSFVSPSARVQAPFTGQRRRRGRTEPGLTQVAGRTPDLRAGTVGHRPPATGHRLR